MDGFRVLCRGLGLPGMSGACGGPSLWRALAPRKPGAAAPPKPGGPETPRPGTGSCNPGGEEPMCGEPAGAFRGLIAPGHGARLVGLRLSVVGRLRGTSRPRRRGGSADLRGHRNRRAVPRGDPRREACDRPQRGPQHLPARLPVHAAVRRQRRPRPVQRAGGADPGGSRDDPVSRMRARPAGAAARAPRRAATRLPRQHTRRDLGRDRARRETVGMDRAGSARGVRHAGRARLVRAR